MGTGTHPTETASQLKHTLCVFSLSAPKPSPSPQERLCSDTSTFQSIRELYPGVNLTSRGAGKQMIQLPVFPEANSGGIICDSQKILADSRPCVPQ